MKLTATLISSLEKIRSGKDLWNRVSETRVFRGERFSWQIAVESDFPAHVEAAVTSPLAEHISLYSVRDCVMDMPSYRECDDENYLTLEPGVMPDLLLPLEQQGGREMIATTRKTFWAELRIPADWPAGRYAVTLTFTDLLNAEHVSASATMQVEVLEAVLPQQELLFTQWFHVDCIASAHNVPIYSEAHWALIERYMAMAADLGINMILTPVITPPLDTEIGTHRPNTQLVQIEKRGEQFLFDFSLLRRWIAMAKRVGMRYYEISHLFSQWGAGFAPNIFVTEDGTLKHMFGWHVKADDPSYRTLLEQLLPALLAVLEEEGIAEQCYFHISDEPREEHIPNYRRAMELVAPLLQNRSRLDALSNYEFYEDGLVPNPVCAINHIEPFLEHQAENLWAYYCCGQWKDVSNRFMAMPSSRHRIIGLQLYKFRIKGFLHWGYNFYYSQCSRYEVNPYVTSSADGRFPSGDSFSVYPGKNGPLKSLRAVVFHEALQDLLVCRMLEEKIGYEAVVQLIDSAAGMNLTFADYPKNSTFIPALMDKMKAMLR